MVIMREDKKKLRDRNRRQVRKNCISESESSKGITEISYPPSTHVRVPRPEMGLSSSGGGTCVKWWGQGVRNGVCVRERNGRGVREKAACQSMVAVY